MNSVDDSVNPDISVPPVKIPRPPRIWKFIGTSLWGLLAFAAMFFGQVVVLAYFLARGDTALDLTTFTSIVSSGTTISLSVIMGLPAVLAALWIATRLSRTPFADYLALRATTWTAFAGGVAGLAVLLVFWSLVTTWAGSDQSPGFMVDVLKTARADGLLWLLVIAFCVAAPVTEELFVRGFLYRGWSESFLRPVGAIVLSSAVWTAMHLQYDWFFLMQVFSIGLLLGYLRYRSNSTWLPVAVHGVNNLAATIQTFWLASHS